MQQLVTNGLARAIGASNLTAGRLRHALSVSGAGPRYSVLQNRFTYLRLRRDVDTSP